MATINDLQRHNIELLVSLLQKEKIIQRLEENAAKHKLELASIGLLRARQKQDEVRRVVKQKVKIEVSDELPARAEDGRLASDEEESDSYNAASESHVNRAPHFQNIKKKQRQEIRATPMNTLHNFVKQMEVDDPTAADFTWMRPKDQYMIAAQGTLKGPHPSQTLRIRAENLRAWQHQSNSVSVALQDQFGASAVEYQMWRESIMSIEKLCYPELAAMIVLPGPAPT